MQLIQMFFIIISALHVSAGFSAHHQEVIKLYVQPWVLSSFLLSTAGVNGLELFSLYNVLYYYQCCTRFGRFFRPSSGGYKTVCAALGTAIFPAVYRLCEWVGTV